MRVRLTVLVSTVLVFALSTAAGEARSTQHATISLVSVLRTYVPTDVSPKGLSAGDSVKMTDGLYNAVSQFGKPAGALVGSDTGLEKVLAGRRTASFRGVATLPGGTIVIAGRVSMTAASTTAPVVGGTGRFAHAHGTVRFRTLSANGTASNVFRLALP
ncbi:MAG TPA: dirigent protein [Gaiellaceae bacterium]|nr:dirigent protein [Gaiellaceae bacterium]